MSGFKISKDYLLLNNLSKLKDEGWLTAEELIDKEIAIVSNIVNEQAKRAFNKEDNKMDYMTKEKISDKLDNIADRLENDSLYWSDDAAEDLKELRKRVDKKVVMPKWFDDWYEELIADNEYNEEYTKEEAIHLITQAGYGHNLYKNTNSLRIVGVEGALDFIVHNKLLAIEAVLNGYEVEKEVLYVLKFPSIGRDSLFVYKIFNGDNTVRVGTCINDISENSRYHFTQEEINKMDPIYDLIKIPLEEL